MPINKFRIATNRKTLTMLSQIQKLNLITKIKKLNKIGKTTRI